MGQHAGLAIYDFSLDATSCSQFVPTITEGGARGEICLSAKNLFFIFTSLIYRKDQQVKQGSMWSRDLRGVPGPEMARAWGCLVSG